jgi:hypothetical protein
LTLRKLEQRPQDAIAALQLAMEKGWQSVEWEWYDRIKGNGHRESGEAIPPGKAVAYDAPAEY